jgi:hypothetical protein
MASNSKNIAELLNTDTTVTVVDVADGSITEPKLASTLDLSGKTLSLTAASVNAHVTQFDDSNVRNDIAHLALRDAINENKTAYNFGNTFLENFQDASGIDTASNASRNASEFISTLSETTTEFHPRAELTWANSLVNPAENWTAGPTVNGSQNKWESNAVGSGYSYTTNTADYAKYFFEFQVLVKGGGGGPFWGFGINKNGGTASAAYYGTSTSSIGSFGNFDSGSSVGGRLKITYDPYTDPNVIAVERDQAGDGTFESITNTVAGGSYTGSAWTSTGQPTTIGFHCPGWRDSGSNWQIGLRQGTKTVQTFNTSGNFTSTNQTASSSVSSMGIVVIHSNQHGTNSINTDIVAQLSADGGANYSTVTLESRGVFASGQYISIANNVSVTAGTQPKYKINFANQSNGAKEARIIAVGLLY